MSRIKNFQKKMVELSADAALISSELNIRYLSKFNFTDGYILVTRDNAYLFTDFRYIEAAKAQVDANDFTIVMPETTMGVALAQTLDNVGANRGGVAANSIMIIWQRSDNAAKSASAS